MAQLDHSCAAERNKQPILELLDHLLPDRGAALEIASGTGQHVVWFAHHLPAWTWQPSDVWPDALASMSSRITQQGLHNVRPPLMIDVTANPWFSVGTQSNPLFDLVYCANMLHISPWASCAALMQGTSRHLAPGGRLITYGPYLEGGVATSEGNLAFDKSLRMKNPDWGIRRLEDVRQLAAASGLQCTQRHAMPANNLLLVWTQTPTAQYDCGPHGHMRP